MKISAKLTAVIFAAIAAFASVSCEKIESNIKPEEILGSFSYNGNTYNIRSVVVYTLDNGQTEIWISETAGYTTVEQIEASVGELVINMRTAKIENEDEQSEDKPKDNLWIKYEGNINDGKHIIKCSLNKNNTTISLDFLSFNSDFTNKIEGSYNGPYTDYSVPDLNNQWAYNRQAQDITTADYFEMEDENPSRLILYYKDGKAIELTIPKADVGPEIVIKADEANKYSRTSVTYDNGEEFNIFSGEIQIITDRISKNLKVHIKLSNSAGKTLRADYQGAYRHRFGNKTNRCIYSSGSEGGNGYDGTFLLSSMKVSESDKVTFTFTPGEHLDGGQIFATNPTLTVDKSLIGLGEVNTQDISDALSFKYYTFQLGYEYNTEAISGSVINIERNSDGIYTINAELAYVSGTVTKHRDKVDENENLVYEWVLSDEFDEDGNQIKVERVAQEEYQEDVITTIDLFYNGPATND